jgi:hypothetical protein
MSIVQNAGAGEVSLGFYDYTIDQSVRVDDTANGQINKNAAFPTATNQKKAAISFWFKRCKLGASTSTLYHQAGTSLMIQFDSSDRVYLYDYSHGGWQIASGEVFRDVGSWYHFCLILDSTQGTAANRSKWYVNGTLQDLSTWTNFDTALPTQDTNFTLNTGSSLQLTLSDNSGYFAEYVSIDGQASSISDFGETKDGIWVAKDPSGLTFGNAGFYLNFSTADLNATGSSRSDPHGSGTDQPNNTFADRSGNGQHFDVVNVDVNDIVLDSPTNNFPTFNNLLYHGTTYSEGNLKNASPGNDWETQVATMFPSTLAGKWYCEFYVHTCNASGTRVGVGVTDDGNDPEDYLGNQSPDVAYYDINDFYTGGSKTADSNLAFAAGDIISVALNLDDGEVTFRKNNSTMTNGTQDLIANTLYTFASTNYGSGSGVVANFGQDDSFAGVKTSGSAAASDGNGKGDFFYAPPSGFLSLCSANLVDPTIGPEQDTLADDNFNTVLYTGNAGTQSITGVGFSPDWLWVKNRATTYSHALVDSVRGATLSLASDSTAVERTSDITSLDSDGFSLQFVTATGSYSENQGSQAYVAWNWLAGTAFSNDASATGVGSIDSEGQVNTKAGFSIVKFTTDGETSGTVAHGLGVQPQLLIGKTRNHVVPWYVQTPLLATTQAGILNATDAFYNPGYNHWNDTHPTTSVFSVGGYMADHADLTNPSTKIVYCFANVEGYSKVGTYLGNGNADGPFIYTGFRPAWVLFKGITQASNWCILDNKRSPSNLADDVLLPNATNTESTSLSDVDFVSNGIKIRDTVANDTNISGKSYVYLAFAEQPFKFANAR